MHGQCFWHLLLPRMWAIIITILILMLMTLLKMQLRAFSISELNIFETFKLTIIWKMTIYNCVTLHWDVLCSFLPLPLPPVSTQCSKWILSKPGRIKWTNQDSSCYTTQYIANDKQGCFRDCTSCTMCTKVHHMYTSYDELLSVAILRSWELF